jgi:hypothetical protein
MLAQLAGSFLDNLFAKDRQDDAQTFSAQQFASRYQTTVKDMEAAGLNPALAYQQGGGSPPSGAVSSPGSNFSQAAQASAQTENIKADTKNKAAQTNLIEGQAAQAWASAGQSAATVQKMDHEIDKLKAETANLPDEGRRIRAAVNMLAEQGALMAQQGSTQVEVRNQLAAAISKMKSETKLLDFDISAIEKFDNFGKEYQQYRPIIELIKAIFQPRGGGITINK